MFQEEGPLPGLKLGSCLTLRNELSEEIHVLTKQEILLGKGAQVEGGDASAEETSAKKPQHFAKSSNIYLGLRDIFNNPINKKNSFECLLALGKTLFPRQIALNF